MLGYGRRRFVVHKVSDFKKLLLLYIGSINYCIWQNLCDTIEIFQVELGKPHDQMDYWCPEAVQNAH